MIDLPLDWFPLAQSAAQTAQTGGQALSGWLIFLILLAIFAVPFALGKLIARALKLRQFSGKIAVVLFTLILGLAPFAWHLQRGMSRGLTAGESLRNAIRLGIDLAGGTNLVFEVQETPERQITDDVMDQTVAAISRRINPSGTEEVIVRQVGRDRIEVTIPGADPEVVRQKKSLMTRLGTLEFAILANRRDHAEIIRQAQATEGDIVRRGGRVVARWVPVAVGEGGTPKSVSERGEVVARPMQEDGEPVTAPNGEPVKEFLVVVPPEGSWWPEPITGEFLVDASPDTGSAGSPIVRFQFNQRGGYLFRQLTTHYQPARDGFERRLAVVLDGRIHSAPGIQEPIGSRGQISGQFTRAEVNELVSVLDAGALPVLLNRNPVSEQSISPTLGHDVQVKGMRAIAVSLMAVLVFMGVYYLFAGMVADLCLVFNLILIMGVMALIDATFTLPGLAGIVLTIGMAVDANVLIFERIREESNRGSSLRMSIQNGFSRALPAIVDANVTTLITAVILYMIGTDQVRGFAVTLFIGIVMSMYTALYFGRLLFDIWERKGWLRNLRMLSMLGATRWNFLSKRGIAAVGSVALIVAGMGALYARGERNFDIDFSGGTMVTFEFEKPQQIEEVRDILQQAPEFGSNITLERLVLAGEEASAAAGGRRFRLRTVQTDIDKVREALHDTLTESGKDLVQVQMDYGEITRIPADAGGGDGENGDQPQETADFAGGHRVRITFDDPRPYPGISTATAARYFETELNRITTEGGQPKYDAPQSLFKFTGTAGPGADGGEFEMQRFTEMTLRVSPEVAVADLKTALASMQARMAETPLFEEVTSFDAQVAQEMQRSALLAILTSLVAIIGYLWFRFQRVTFGFAAVSALVHDVLVVSGVIALAALAAQTPIGPALLLTDFRINLPMVAAFLTIIGYSLNDTIVVFDRIREVRGKNPGLTADMINVSLNQTLGRTIMTSLTTLVVVGILYAFGGEGIHGFAFALVIGVLVGTYSSMYVASPVLLWLMNRPGSATARASTRTRTAKTAAG